jgi:hypothetical protein
MADKWGVFVSALVRHGLSVNIHSCLNGTIVRNVSRINGSNEWNCSGARTRGVCRRLARDFRHPKGGNQASVSFTLLGAFCMNSLTGVSKGRFRLSALKSSSRLQ